MHAHPQVLSGIEGLLKKQAVALKHEEATTIRQVPYGRERGGGRGGWEGQAAVVWEGGCFLSFHPPDDPYNIHTHAHTTVQGQAE